MNSPERYEKARNITLVGAVVNVLQGILKVIFGWLGHSHGLIADGLHSFSDVITDILVIFAAHYGNQDADIDHPYGHGRIETAATVALAILVAMAGFGIVLDAIEHFLAPKAATAPLIYTLVIAIFSMVANEVVFRLTLKQAKSIKHQLLEANALHHRSDAACSAIVIVGIAGSLMGWVYLDAIAAMIVGLMIIKMGWNLAWLNVQELVDTGLDEATLKAIKDTIRQVEGVRALHQLRTRSMAGRVFLDVHILVDPHLTVSEGHYITAQVESALRGKFENIVDVTVHVDPENDETSLPSKALPSREALQTLLEARWRSIRGYDAILTLNMHYLNGKLILEVTLPLTILSEPAEGAALQALYADAVKDIAAIEAVCLLFR
jgi:cation diffusion facilitator family transporter